MARDKVRQHEARGFVVDPFPDNRAKHYRSYVGRHKGKPAIVYGNGPSMAMHSPDDLQRAAVRSGAIVWGVNNMWSVCNGQSVGKQHYHVVLDEGFWESNRDQLHAHIAATRCLPVTCFEVSDDIDYMMIPIGLGETPNTSPAYTPGKFFHGYSSGVAAIQMAMQCGCDPICILGHDLTAFGTMTHGFGKRSDDEQRRNYPQGKAMFSAYDLLSKHAEQIGCTILNLSHISAIQCFERALLLDAL